MNKQLVKEYLGITFGLMLLGWGSAALLSRFLGLTIQSLPLRCLHILGGFSPTVASYAVLKRWGRVDSVKQWLWEIFSLRHSAAAYGATVLFVAVYYILGCCINGFTLGAPLFVLPVVVPMMLVGGGNEEAGWRMVLQPELEKACGFPAAAAITGVIWWLWHLPLFFIAGTANADMNYFLFGIMCLSLSFAFGAVARLSNGVFPCVLAHCLVNGLSASFLFSYSLTSCLVTLAVTAVLSLLAVKAAAPAGSR